MIKGIFWDNDGVLVDTEALYFQATAEILQQVDVTLSRPEFVDISLVRGKSPIDLARARGIDDNGLKTLRDLRNSRYAELLRDGVPVLDGVEETLQALHGRVRMGIVTSSRRDHFEIIHSTTGLLKYFDFVLTREDYTFSKPHPEPYLTALARSGLSKDDCMVIEDSERGLRAALRAGLRCLITPGELTCHSDFPGAFRVLKSIRDLPETIS